MEHEPSESVHRSARRRAWVIAARPQTLPAAAAPVIVGTGFAIHDGVLAVGPMLAALIGAMLIQIGTNFANDYYDAEKGVDTDSREGFTRVTQAGLLPPARVRVAAFVTFGLAILLGTYLVAVGGVPILIVGLLSVISGIAYAGGPYPFGSHGLGDGFVFVFFGIIAVTGTYYVQAVTVVTDGFPVTIPAEAITTDVLVASIPVGCLATAILVVNNIRDIETDRAAGKRTLAVRIGRRYSRLEYGLLLAIPYVIPLYFVTAGYGTGVLITYLTIPYAVMLYRTVATETGGDALNPALERTGKLLAAYSALLAIGVVV